MHTSPPLPSGRCHSSLADRVSAAGPDLSQHKVECSIFSSIHFLFALSPSSSSSERRRNVSAWRFHCSAPMPFFKWIFSPPHTLSLSRDGAFAGGIGGERKFSSLIQYNTGARSELCVRRDLTLVLGLINTIAREVSSHSVCTQAFARSPASGEREE